MTPAGWVEYFRGFFDDGIAENATALDDKQREEYAKACWAAFAEHDDPRCWEGFSELPALAQYALNGTYGLMAEAGVLVPDFGFGEPTQVC